jgi:hypothetical protein
MADADGTKVPLADTSLVEADEDRLQSIDAFTISKASGVCPRELLADGIGRYHRAHLGEH